MNPPEKPCPWHAVIESDIGRLKVVYCEVGPAGHEGTHIGERSRVEYLRLMRAWNRDRNVQRKELYSGTSSEPGRVVLADGSPPGA